VIRRTFPTLDRLNSPRNGVVSMGRRNTSSELYSLEFQRLARKLAVNCLPPIILFSIPDASLKAAALKGYDLATQPVRPISAWIEMST
jgi:hypothetical protein